APPLTLTSVEGDTASTYYDTVNDSNTDIVLTSTDTPSGTTACRWYTTDSGYDAGTGTACASATSCSFTGVDTEGTTYNRYIACVDAAGNGNDAANNLDISWTNDYTAPPLTLTNVEGDTASTYYDTVNDSNTDIVLASTDAVSGTTGCRWYTSDSAYNAGTGTACASSTSCSFTGAATEGSTYTYSIACVDAAGNGNDAANNLDISWTNDYTAPPLTLTSVEGDNATTYYDTTNDSNTDIVLTSTDAVSGTTGCRWYTTDSAYNSGTGTACASATACQFTDALNADTAYTRYIACVDAAGNGNSTANNLDITWTNDWTAPTFAGLTSATATSETNVNLAWSAGSDTVTATGNIVYQICREAPQADCQGSFNATFTTSAGAVNYGDGSLTFGNQVYYVVRARDEAGNVDTNTVEKYARTWSTTGVAKAISGHIGKSACALMVDGTVKCWGRNAEGQIGDGTTVNKSAPVAVSSLTNAVSVTGGYMHTCALLSDGTVECWGRNLEGQLGNGTTATLTSTPVGVSSLSSVLAVTGGGSYQTCALISDGSVKCWGINSYGQLGDGTTANKTTPVAVTSLTGAIAVASGGDVACSLVSDGSVKCWGRNLSGEIGDGTTLQKTTPVAVSSLSNAVAVAAGSGHMCALMSDGTVKCWGGNAYGRLGDGTTVDKWTPVAVSTLTNAATVSPGGFDTCSLLSDGTVKCWGMNYWSATSFGQLGDGTTVDKWTPVAVSTLTNAVAISTAEFHVCALLSNGTVNCWGAGPQGELGDGTTVSKTTPVAVSFAVGPMGVRNPNLHESTASGAPARPFREGLTNHLGLHTCSLLSDGTVKCWGYNLYGQLGDGTTADKLTPVSVASLSSAIGIAGGQYHTCSLLSDGTVKCWGWNGNGQLGNGTTADKSTPVAVSTLSGAVAVAGGTTHTCSLLSDGTVKCWGYNGNGQVGDGTTVQKTTPVAVSTLSGAVAVSGGNVHTCSLLSDGTVKCWGYNPYGQLGDGTTANKSTPVAVSTLSGVVAIAAGNSHTCSLRSDGTVKCWGYNPFGQLGDGTTVNKSTPVAVSTLSGAVAVAGGVNHTCSLLSDGTVKCWGSNGNGQLGDGTTVNKSTPVPVASLSAASGIAGGNVHTCSLQSDGMVKCWGSGQYGQLGDGTTVNRLTPVPVTNLP
ncbi:MAG: hypothetical protein HYT87_20215, partial [Nitrospirae bacterium]|nr:hypothetical protein [Nitrospirota bacterium]